MQWCHCQCHWYCRKPMLMSMASYDTDTNVSCVVMPTPMPVDITDSNGVIRPKQSCCISFQSSYTRNAMVPLIMPLDSCDVNARPMVSHYQKHYDASHFDCLDLRNAVIPLVSCNANTNGNGIT